MSKKQQCAIYSRVSSEESRDSGLSIEVQEKTCRKAITDKGMVVAEVFKDEGISAFLKKPRPGFQQMMSRLDEFDVIVVWKLDRLSRRERELHNVLGEIVEAGVGFWSVTEGFDDLMTPMGRAMMGVTATFAELWSALTQERVRSAVQQAASEGRKHSFPPYGYFLPAPKAVIQPDPEKAPIVRRIFDWYAEGKSLVQICRGLQADGILSPRGNDFWTVGTIRRMLERQTYLGKIVHGRSGQVFEGQHEAIVDREVFDACQKRLQLNKGVASRARTGSLGHMLRCGYCGSRLHVTYPRKKRQYYCRKRRLSWHQHEPLFIAGWIIEGYIWMLVEGMALSDAELAWKAGIVPQKQLSDTQMASLRDEREQLEETIKYNLRAAREAGLPINLLAEENAPHQQRLQEVERQISKITSEYQPVDAVDFRKEVASARQAGYQEQREFLSRFISRVEVFREKIVCWSVMPGEEPLVLKRQKFSRRQPQALRLLAF